MKTVFTIFFLSAWTFSFAQSNKFKAQLFVEDSSQVSGGVIIFPLKRDTSTIDNSDIAIIDLSKPENRVFYFLWSGWKSKVFRFDTNQTSFEVKKVWVPDTVFYRQFEEKHICPICLKSKPLIPIKYGMPTKKMLRQAKNGEFRLGGCMISVDSPKLYCKLDDFEF